MSKEPMVSVVMIVHNEANFISEAIMSVLGQTFRDFELIVVNDGSTDETRVILEEFAKKDNRMRLLHLEESGGHVALVPKQNRAMDMARGKYIARFDGDDIFLPDKLEKQVKYMEANPEVTILGGGAENISEDGKHLSYFHPKTSFKDISKILPHTNCIYNPTVMIRNDGDIRYRLPFIEDYDFFLQHLKAGSVIENLPDVLIKYRVKEGSLSRMSAMRTLLYTDIAQQLYMGDLRFESLGKKILKGQYTVVDLDKKGVFNIFNIAFRSKNYVGLEEAWAVIKNRYGVLNRIVFKYLFVKVKLYIANSRAK